MNTLTFGGITLTGVVNPVIILYSANKFKLFEFIRGLMISGKQVKLKRHVDHSDIFLENQLIDVEEKVKKIWQKVLNKENIALDENFFDVGGDSLLLPHLLFMLQEEFGEEIELIHIATFPKIKEFSNFLIEKNFSK